MAQHPVAMLQILVKLYVPQGDQAVEPSEGDCFHRWAEAILLDACNQLLPFFAHGFGKRLTGDENHIALLGHRFGLFGRQSEERSPIRHGLNEITPSLGTVGLELVTVHPMSSLAHMAGSFPRIHPY